jgi:hypothetical protein
MQATIARWCKGVLALVTITAFAACSLGREPAYDAALATEVTGLTSQTLRLFQELAPGTVSTHSDREPRYRAVASRAETVRLMAQARGSAVPPVDWACVRRNSGSASQSLMSWRRTRRSGWPSTAMRRQPICWIFYATSHCSKHMIVPRQANLTQNLPPTKRHWRPIIPQPWRISTHSACVKPGPGRNQSSRHHHPRPRSTNLTRSRSHFGSRRWKTSCAMR